MTTGTFTWSRLVPFAAGQALAIEIRRFVFSIRGTGAVTALTDGELRLALHIPPQMGIDDTALDFAFAYRGTETGNGVTILTRRKGRESRMEHDDVRMTLTPKSALRIERKAAGEKDIAFTIARAANDAVTIGDIAGFGQLDGATITIRAG
ncbi:MAG: hypothetical protein KDK07_05420 [Bauldia sp.]|nr:hypothetical protein [Bauldia sp.]